MAKRASDTDRISIGEKHHQLYKDLTTGDRRAFSSMRDVFVLAAVLGFEEDQRKKVAGKRVQIFDTGVLRNEDHSVLRALALAAEGGDVSVLESDGRVIRIAEEFAHGGVERLKNLATHGPSQTLVSVATHLLRGADSDAAASESRATQEASASPPPTLDDLLRQGEGAAIEFKQSLRWDAEKGNVNKALQGAIAKAVAGFLNAEGGTLLIGVADNGEVVGIEHDFKTLRSKGNRDGFELTLREEIGKRLGKQFNPFVDVRFEKSGRKTVCLVGVKAAPRPVYFSEGSDKVFYARAGNSTPPMDVEAATEYIAMHFK